MGLYNFSVEIEPRPKKRPKVYRWSTVNPSEEDERELADAIRAHPNCPSQPLTGQIKVQFKFFKSPPKNTPKWKLQYMEHGLLRPATSPDLDNYVKLALDALNGIVWEDDRYIVESHSAKYYTLSQPRIEIIVEHYSPPRLQKDAEELYHQLSQSEGLDNFFESTADS